MALDDGTSELKRALTDPDGGGGVFEAAIADDEGILSEILARLPVKSVMRFRCVCKPWRALIAAPYFRIKHFQYSERGIGHNTSRLLFSMEPPRSLDLEALKNMYLEEEENFVAAISDLDLPVTISSYCNINTFVLGSCNGLVCLFMLYKGILIWNPSTREISNLLPIPLGGHFTRWGCMYGFGYDSITEDYKILIATTEIHIFALKTGSWKTIPNPKDYSLLNTEGFFFNGALHWYFVDVRFDQRARVFVSFNLEEERFQEMAPLSDIIPPNLRGQEFAALMVLGNCLCLVQLVRQTDSSSLCLVTEYGVVTKSWTQIMNFSIEPLESWFATLLPLCTFKHGMVLVKKFVNDRVTGRWTTVLLLINQTTSKIIFEDDYRRMLGPTIYRESLVSPVTLAGSIAGHQYQ